MATESDRKRAEIKNGLPLLEYKLVKGETRIYVCVDKACQRPVNEVSEAIKQMEQGQEP